jgi:hypothetical protein
MLVAYTRTTTGIRVYPPSCSATASLGAPGGHYITGLGSKKNARPKPGNQERAPTGVRAALV